MCHRISQEQPQPLAIWEPDEMESVQAPTFSAIANKYASQDKELRAYILAPDHPMRGQNWRDSDLDALIAYIKSLRSSHW